MITDLHKTLEELLNRLLADGDRYLVEVEVKGTPAKPMIWIYVDSEKGGIGIDEYAKLSREVLFHAEQIQGMPESFTLNVSSPGLDRPLSDPRQFKANIGRQAQVKLRLEGATQTHKGKLTSVEGDRFELTDDKGASRWFDMSGPAETKIIPVFK